MTCGYPQTKPKLSLNNGSHRPEVREKIRQGVLLAMQRPEVKAKISGSHSIHWTDGIATERKNRIARAYLEAYGSAFTEVLRRSIRRRDNFQCQVCRETISKISFGRAWRLQVHHIDYNKRNNDPSNLISLCQQCHLKTNYQRPFWTKYFQNRIQVKVGLKSLQTNLVKP